MDTAVPEAVKARFEAEAIPLLPRLRATAVRLTGNRPDAEDLLQETYLRAYRGFARFEPGTNLTAWLYRILRNTFISGYRKRLREPKTCPEGDHHQTVNDAWRNATASAESIVLDAMPDERLREALSSLPERYRQAVLLYDVEGFSCREIARTIGVPLGTVMSRLHRGRAALRDSTVGPVGTGVTSERRT
jgi:RNA polymerase sigma-70 factor (ECF subfamily)